MEATEERPIEVTKMLLCQGGLYESLLFFIVKFADHFF
jgi:hypothetical protein